MQYQVIASVYPVGAKQFPANKLGELVMLNTDDHEMANGARVAMIENKHRACKVAHAVAEKLELMHNVDCVITIDIRCPA